MSKLIEQGVQASDGTLTLRYMNGNIDGVKTYLENSGILFLLMQDMQWICVRRCMPINATFFYPFKDPPEEPPVDRSIWEDVIPLVEEITRNCDVEEKRSQEIVM